MNSDFNKIMLDPSNVIIPRGWRVISHGTSFGRWLYPSPGHLSQDLKSVDRIVVNDTINGGLVCLQEKDAYSLSMYTMYGDPAILRVFVPYDFSHFDSNTIEDSLRFLKPNLSNTEEFLVPSGTTLIKLAETVGNDSKSPAVIWCVPEQFVGLLERDINSLKFEYENKSVDEVLEPTLELDPSFVSVDESSEDDVVLEEEDVADVFYEDLELKQQDEIDAEIEASEKKAEKRAKDREAARAKDKKVFAEREAEYERQVAEANALREKAQEATSYSSPAIESDMYSSDNNLSNNSSLGESYLNEKSDVIDDIKGYDYQGGNENYGNDNVSIDQSVFDKDFKPSLDKPVDDFQSLPKSSNYPEDIRRSQFADDYDIEEAKRKEEYSRFRKELQEEALRRQERSDNYESFGSYGVDFSGHDNHSSYSKAEEKSNDNIEGKFAPIDNSDNVVKQTITSEEFKKYEDDFYATRNDFRSYEGEVPKHIEQAYQEASDRYFSMMRNVEAGFVVVESYKSYESEPFEPVSHSVKNDGFEKSPSEQSGYIGTQEAMSDDFLRRQKGIDNYDLSRSPAANYSNNVNNALCSQNENKVKGVYGDVVLPVDNSDNVVKQTITSEEFKKYEQNFYTARNDFRSYEGEVPKHIEQAYQEASDRYFSMMRNIEAGSVVVESYKSYDSKPFDPVGHSVRNDGFEKSSSEPYNSNSVQGTPKDRLLRTEGRSMGFNNEDKHSNLEENSVSPSGSSETSRQIGNNDAEALIKKIYEAIRVDEPSTTQKVKADTFAGDLKEPLSTDNHSVNNESLKKATSAPSSAIGAQEVSSGNLSRTDNRSMRSNNEDKRNNSEEGFISRSDPNKTSKQISNNDASDLIKKIQEAIKIEEPSTSQRVKPNTVVNDVKKPSGSDGVLKPNRHIDNDWIFAGLEDNREVVSQKLRETKAKESSEKKEIKSSQSNTSSFNTLINSHQNNQSESVSKRSDRFVNSVDSANKKRASGTKSFTTAQNTQTGFAPTPKDVANLKNPPKSPIDNRPLTFSKERFRAIKRLASNSANASYRIGSAVTHQIARTAFSEETGTAHNMSSAGRYVSSGLILMDVLAKGSGRADAQKALKEYIASEKGIKVKQVSKKDIEEFGKLNLKNVDCKIKETLSVVELNKMRKKFGKAADLSVADAIGTRNGQIGKIRVVVDNKVEVRFAEGKIGKLRDKAANLKSEIKVLKSKGSSLSVVERQRYMDLVAKKKKVQDELNRTVGATNTRIQKESLYRQINAMSPQKLEKELKKLEDKLKKGLKLNKVQKQQLKLMRQRKALMKAREALYGRGVVHRAGTFIGVAGRGVGKAMRNSNDETFSAMTNVVYNIQSAYHFVTHRYVRGALKWSIRGVMFLAKTTALPVALPAKIIDRKIGLSKSVKKSVKKEVSKVTNKVSSRLLHTKPGEKIHTAYSSATRLHKSVVTNGGLKTSVKKAVGNVVPNKWKSAAEKVRKAFNKLNNNKLVKGTKKVLSAPVKGFQLINKGVQFVKKIVMKYIMIPIACFVLGAFVVSVVCTMIMNVPGAVFAGDKEADGKIDLTSYIEILNKEQKKINNTVSSHKENTEANGGEYKKVYVNYLGGAHGNNYKEILSMTAVYFSQEFSNEDAVNDYLIQLFNASNYITTEKSDIYYCSGCEERSYKCTEDYDKYATDKRIQLHNTYSERGGCQEHKNVISYLCTTAPGWNATAKQRDLYNKYHSQGGCKKSSTQRSYKCTDPLPDDASVSRHEAYLNNHDGKGCKSYPGASSIVYYCPGHTEEINVFYYCSGHSETIITYSCPGHTETVCKGHVDLYVNVVCMGFDKLFSADPGTTAGKDLGDYEQGDLIGTFNISYYCTEKHAHICNDAAPGTNDDGKTASGTVATAGRTIAVDPDVIPLGTAVVINGHTYIAEDTGGAIQGNRIDIAVSTHQEALSLGRDVFKVYKATDAEGTDKGDIQRSVITYRDLAKASASDYLSERLILQAFGKAKEPEIVWKYDRVNYDDEQSYAEKLQKYDDNHKNEPFSNVEVNTFEYIKMSLDELRSLAKERGGKDYSKKAAFYIITDVLIPYDKKHPDVYIVDPESGNDGVEKLYFEGWTKDNKEWAKSILKYMKSDVYAGLDKIDSGGSVGGGGGSISLEGVTIRGNKIEVVYYSQHDSRWAHSPIRSDYPSSTITKGGCGPTSMAIVVSSLTEYTIDPPGMCEKFGKAYYSPGAGSYWSIVSGISAAYDLSCTELRYNDVQGVINALNEGKLVVALVGSGGVGYTGNGYYRGGGHFLVICGVTEDGNFLMADPNEPEISISGKGVDIEYFLDSGIKTWWAIGVK